MVNWKKFMFYALVTYYNVKVACLLLLGIIFKGKKLLEVKARTRPAVLDKYTHKTALVNVSGFPPPEIAAYLNGRCLSGPESALCRSRRSIKATDVVRSRIPRVLVQLEVPIGRVLQGLLVRRLESRSFQRTEIRHVNFQVRRT